MVGGTRPMQHTPVVPHAQLVQGKPSSASNNHKNTVRFPIGSSLESIASTSRRSKLSNALKAALTQHVIDELAPALRAALTTSLPTQPANIEVIDDA